MKKKIMLSKYFDKNITTRNSLKFILSEVKNSDDIVFDFNKIEFISRSCADEYLKVKECFAKSFRELNMSNNVKSMLEVVSNSRKGLCDKSPNMPSSLSC